MHRVQIRQKMKLEFNRLALLVRNDPILQLTRLGMTEGKKSRVRAISRTGGIPKQNRFVAFNSKFRKNRNLFWKFRFFRNLTLSFASDARISLSH